MTADIVRVEHDSASDMALAVARRLEALLRAGLQANGAASIALSGGTTPGAVYRELGTAGLDWRKVTVTLIDERWAPDTDPRSNAKLVKESLFQGPAAAAAFIPLWTAAPYPPEAAAAAGFAMQKVRRPFDAIVMGMGEDGHTASWFPGAHGLDRILDPRFPGLVAAIDAPGPGEIRLTQSLACALDTQAVLLLLKGPAKRSVLDKALAGDEVLDMPVRAVFRHSPVPVEVHLCP